MMKKFLLTALLICIISDKLVAQHYTDAKKLIERVTKHQSILPEEKLYLNFDKPYYSTGDTIWFKSYILDADLTAKANSRKIYVELVNDSNHVVERKVLLATAGLAWGDFILKKDADQGNYAIRAYTNHQQNFGSDYFFIRKFVVGKIEEKTWLVSAEQQINKNDNNTEINLTVKIKNLKNEVFSLKNIELNLMSANKTLLRKNASTNAEGIFNTTFNITDDKDGSDLYLVVRDKLNQTGTFQIPVVNNTKTDLQFMPEGGDLIFGLYGKVAFKAIDLDGMGVKLNGKILNDKKEEIKNFSTNENGIGSFFLMPNKGETYTAIVNSPAGNTQNFKLPLAKESGISLRIDNLSSPDSIKIYIRATTDHRLEENFPLIAQNGTDIVYAANINLKNGFYNTKLDKKSFPPGITHFTLFSPNGLPINERIIMIGAPEKIAVKVTPNQKEYATLDSVNLRLNFADDQMKAIALGSFSISVTDNQQLKGNQDLGNIYTHYFLESNLKGHIENPSSYFKNNSHETREALDNLLLAQGWIGYDWSKILSPILTPKFKIEAGNSIYGRVSSMFNVPLADRKVNLLSLGKENIYMDTITNKEGNFEFVDLPILDSPAYVIKIKTVKGKSSTGTIKVDEFTPSLTRINYSKKPQPWYFNTDTTLLNYYQKKEKLKNEVLTSQLRGNMLKEVFVTKKVVLKADENRAYPSKLRNHITEEMLKQEPRTTLQHLLYKKVPGFSQALGTYFIGSLRNGTIADVIIDSISTRSIGGDYNASNRQVFGYLNAEDIKDIKVFRSADATYLTIITRSGSGPGLMRASGVYVYRPIPIHIPRVFYSPKYAVKPVIKISDSRATLFWNPNVMSDENGNASVSFYAGSNPSTYTITIEGTDLNGRFAYATKEIKIDPLKINP